MEKNQVILIGAIVIIGYFVITQNPTQQQPSPVPGNGTAPVQSQGAIVDLSRSDILPWGIAALLVIYIVWKHQQSNQKAYKDTEEAEQDLREKLKIKDVSPIVIQSGHFSDPETKIEYRGYVICTNPQYEYCNDPIWFEIRKNGSLAFDPKVVREPLPARQKTRVIIKKDNQNKEETKK